MTNIDDSHVRDVIDSLRAFGARLDVIMDAISDKRTVSDSEKHRLQTLLISLKADINDASDRQKIDNRRRRSTDIEKSYFGPAMRSASAKLKIKTNSHPINSGWYGCLFDVKTDIAYFLLQLEEQFPHI